MTEEEKEEARREYEKRKSQLERHYVFPDDPCILVHPNRYDTKIPALSADNKPG